MKDHHALYETTSSKHLVVIFYSVLRSCKSVRIHRNLWSTFWPLANPWKSGKCFTCSKFTILRARIWGPCFPWWIIFLLIILQTSFNWDYHKDSETVSSLNRNICVALGYILSPPAKDCILDPREDPGLLYGGKSCIRIKKESSYHIINSMDI